MVILLIFLVLRAVTVSLEFKGWSTKEDFLVTLEGGVRYLLFYEATN